jgi:hypothetical protein
MLGSSWVAAQLAASQEGLSSIEWVSEWVVSCHTVRHRAKQCTQGLFPFSPETGLYFHGPSIVQVVAGIRTELYSTLPPRLKSINIRPHTLEFSHQSRETARSRSDVSHQSRETARSHSTSSLYSYEMAGHYCAKRSTTLANWIATRFKSTTASSVSLWLVLLAQLKVLFNLGTKLYSSASFNHCIPACSITISERWDWKREHELSYLLG